MEPTPERFENIPLDPEVPLSEAKILLGEVATEQVMEVSETESNKMESVSLNEVTLDGSEKTIFYEDGLIPPGWVTKKRLATEYGTAKRTIENATNRYRLEHPEWFQPITNRLNRTYEYFHPELVTLVTQEVTEYKPAPEEWSTVQEASRVLGISSSSARKILDELAEQQPELKGEFKNLTGRTYTHYHSDLISAVSDSTPSYGGVPDDFHSALSIAKNLGLSHHTVKTIATRHSTDHPEWTSLFKNRGRIFEYFHTDLIEHIVADVGHQAPEGWITNTGLSKMTGHSEQLIRRCAEKHRDAFPDEYRSYRGIGKGGRLREYYHPDTVSRIVKEVSSIETAPEGWATRGSLANELQVADHSVKRTTETIRDENPEWFKFYKDRTSKISEHLHPECLDYIRQELSKYPPPPEGWVTNTDLASRLGVHEQKISDTAKILSGDSENIKRFKRKGVRPTNYYSPELISEIKSIFEDKKEATLEIERNTSELKELNEDLQVFALEVSEGASIESQEFQKLLQLFGSERAVDILFQYRPEYKKIDVPYVKSMLGDYLGEFLVVSNHLQLEDLEIGVRYLSDASLKEGLIEVLKKDCLAFYNQKRRDGQTKSDLGAIGEYIANLREQSVDYSTLELEDILNETESYYRSLFDIELPLAMVDELEDGRLFPDLNQRINIKEIERKHKMLIADDMGVGKSASAILAKESLGVKQALIVVPSNVVEVWRKYLSDQQSENGDARGYFKPDQGPRVLIIESLESLQTINPADYDYVILSQERLTDDYIEALGAFDYGMLIVDEVHKLKNIGSGKRAENLVKLASHIEDDQDDKYLALLSGTPVPNKVGDIAMILKLLYPEKFEFVSNKDLTRQILQGDVLDIRSLLVPRMEMKSLAESVEMPKLQEVVHEISLSGAEQAVYDVLLEEDELTATQKLQILRQFILNPGKFDVTPVLESTKIQEVGVALRETFSQKDKVIMFVNGYIDGVIRGDTTIFDELGLPDDVEVHVIDGQVPKARRLEIQKMLQESDKKILLAVSGQTADVGVDFSSADELYFYNEPWTEYDKKQQQGRVYRPGLKKDLISHTFYVNGTVEEGIHKYIEVKYNAVEKLLRGIPLSELEKELLKQDEKQRDANLEVNPALAEYYFSKWNRMLKIYNHVKEMGEEKFVKFLGNYGREYAECYVDLGSRSYQSNANRLAGTVIDELAKAQRQVPEFVRILDVASGPEMLKKHISDEYQQGVISVDINPHHFTELNEKQRVGSFLDLSIADSTIDYANLSLALHYTKFLPTKQNYERLKVLSELNRVLTTSGVAVINLMHTLDLRDWQVFTEAVEKLGFKRVEKYSGRVESGSQFVTRLIVLQKVNESAQEIGDLVKNLGSELLQGFKLTKNEVRLRDSRKIVTSFVLDDKRKIKTKFNQVDRKVLEEESATLIQMKQLKRQYRGIKNIPTEEIQKVGFARVFNGSGYVLFKNLESSNGAVITK